MKSRILYLCIGLVGIASVFFMNTLTVPFEDRGQYTVLNHLFNVRYGGTFELELAVVFGFVLGWTVWCFYKAVKS